MFHIHHRIGIKASIDKVYNALSTVEGIAAWWTRDTTGTSDIGQTMALRFLSLEGNELGSMLFEVKELAPNKQVRWYFHDGPAEWIGTEVTFELSEQDGYTIVLFSHLNWQEEVEFKSHCSMKWAVFLLSLKQFAETGHGQAAPNDIKIDNWN